MPFTTFGPALVRDRRGPLAARSVRVLGFESQQRLDTYSTGADPQPQPVSTDADGYVPEFKVDGDNKIVWLEVDGLRKPLVSYEALQIQAINFDEAHQAVEAAGESASQAEGIRAQITELFLGGNNSINDAALATYMETVGTVTRGVLDAAIAQVGSESFISLERALKFSQLDRQGQAALSALGTAASARLAGGGSFLGGRVTLKESPAEDDNWRIALPPVYDPAIAYPLVLLLHNASGTATNLVTDSRSAAFVAAMSSAGYIVASADASGQAWGNDASRAKYERLYEYVRAQYAVSAVVLVGVSMGGQVGLNILPRFEVPNVVAFLSIAGVASLDSLYSNASYAGNIRNAFDVASDGSDYETKTEGYRPEDRSGWEFRGVPTMFIHSPGDTVCRLEDTTALAMKMDRYTTAQVVESTGVHMAAPQFAAAISDGIPFLQRYAPTPSIPILETAAHWWSADELTTAASVSTWQDSIGGVTLAQPEPSRQPTVAAESVGKSVVFDGANDWLRNSDMSRSAAETVVRIARFTAAPTASRRFAVGGVTGRVSGIASSLDNYIMNGGATITPNPAIAPDTGWHIVMEVWNGADSILSVDGVETSGNGGSSISEGFSLATSNSATSDGGRDRNATGIRVAELIVFNRALNTSERLELMAQLTELRPS